MEDNIIVKNTDISVNTKEPEIVYTSKLKIFLQKCFNSILSSFVWLLIFSCAIQILFPALYRTLSSMLGYSSYYDLLVWVPLAVWLSVLTILLSLGMKKEASNVEKVLYRCLFVGGVVLLIGLGLLFWAFCRSIS